MKLKLPLLSLCLLFLQPAFSQWTPFCSGNSNGTIVDFSIYQDTLFATGLFSRICGDQVPNLAKWNGNNWEKVGSGIPENGHALEIIDDQLYLARYEPDVDSNWIYRWDGNTWSRLGKGIYLSTAIPGFSNTPNLYDVIAYDDAIIACGEFDRLGSDTISGIMRWDGNQWQGLGQGLEGNISNTAPVMFPHQLLEFEGDLIVCGNFQKAGGTVVNGIARWDGSSWLAMGDGFDNTVYGIGIYNGELYAGGAFTQSGSTALSRIAKWNGSEWVSTGFGLSSASTNDFTFIHTIKEIDEQLYIAGGFDQLIPDSGSPVACGSIIALDGEDISVLGGGSTFDIEAIIKYEEQLLIGGGFFNQGYLAVFDPTTDLESISKESQLQTYPNPVDDLLYFEGLATGKSYPYTLYDNHGHIVSSGKLTSNSLSCKSLHQGLYHLQISVEGQQLGLSFLVQHP